MDTERTRTTTSYHPLSHFKDEWKNSLVEHTSNLYDEFPDYHISDPDSLISTSRIHSFQLGTGASIFTQSLIPAITEAKHEVILVTCFWAPSPTLSALREALERLAAERCDRIHSAIMSGCDPDVSPLRIRICFSSRSFLQKLSHTWSRDGYVYPPSDWETVLGLPSPEVLHAGRIDLRVKSLFFLPFSVMHPKFLIVDRQKAWLPSCNVSWEAWLEGCVEITGNAVDGLVKFYRHVWDRQLESHPPMLAQTSTASPSSASWDRPELTSVRSPASTFVALSAGVETPTVLLPSSHHRNPKFDIIPWHDSPPPPPTPLNYAILRLLDIAVHSIYMQTPNLTSAAVIDGLLDALKRGVNVSIVTSKGLMLLEQIFTAGTTTAFCIRSLIRRYQRLEAQYSQFEGSPLYQDSGSAVDVEAQRPPLGLLTIYYFQSIPLDQPEGPAEEPVHSHVKLTIVDDKYTVLGSGNVSITPQARSLMS